MGSVTELVASVAPEDVRVVGAFHNIAADRLANLDTDLDIDTVIVANDSDVAQKVAELAERIQGLRALKAGLLTNAVEVEGLTPFLINLARYNTRIDHPSPPVNQVVYVQFRLFSRECARND